MQPHDTIRQKVLHLDTETDFDAEPTCFAISLSPYPSSAGSTLPTCYYYEPAGRGLCGRFDLAVQSFPRGWARRAHCRAGPDSLGRCAHGEPVQLSELQAVQSG